MNLYFNHRIIDNLDALLVSIDAIKHEANNYKKLELIDSLLALFYDQRLMQWLKEGSEVEKKKAEQLYELYKLWEKDNCNWNDSVALENIYNIFTLQNLTVRYDARDYVEIESVKLYKNGSELDQILFNSSFDINEELTFIFQFKIKQSLKDELNFNLCFEGLPLLNQGFAVNLTDNRNKSISVVTTVKLHHALKNAKPGSFRIELKSNDYTLWGKEFEIISGFLPHEGYALPIVFNKMEVIGHDGINLLEDDKAYINKKIYSDYLDIVYIFDVCINSEFLVDINIDFDYKSYLAEVKTIHVKQSNLHKQVKIIKRLNTLNDLYDVEGNLFVSLPDIPRTTLCLKVFGNDYKFKMQDGTILEFVSCMCQHNFMGLFLKKPLKCQRKTENVGVNSNQNNLSQVDDFIVSIHKSINGLISTCPDSEKVDLERRFYDTETLMLFIKNSYRRTLAVRLPFPFEVVEYSKRFQASNINEVTDEEKKALVVIGEKQRKIISTKNGEITKSFMLGYNSSDNYMLTCRAFFNVYL